MDIEGLMSFLAVAREKSISKAALSLHMTQPALSNRLRKMEDGLGFALLERNWDGVRLTKQGYYFLPYAIQLVQDLHDAAAVLSFAPGERMLSFEEVINRSDQLLIGIDNWLAPRLAQPIIAAFHRTFPQLKYRIITRSTPALVDLVYHHGLHVGIHFHNEARPGLLSVPIIRDGIILIYHPDSAGEEIRPDLSNLDLVKHLPFLLFDNPTLVAHRHITSSIFETYGIEYLYAVDDLYTSAALISEGLAYTMLPKSCGLVFEQFDTAAKLKIVDLSGFAPTDIRMLYSPDHPFIEEIECLRHTLTAIE
ncbi:LysR family transcriptional regulator [Paenibacillus timonensis]|uniref:LysR family transcriptional regulator n=1 Tax=Paenibacillus timonensis TaxID=225915 RepID=A0ABW3S8J1_9BACL|nr:LysR family transcriptional regulator [Paenibacillus timonensis]MBW4840500.1 LysR family transcriptional regulator [Paenibacillaceae bacterium]MCH1639006.1 LysR family transcriptional regulator [Paenibacillus timonensis]